jgi:transposase
LTDGEIVSRIERRRKWTAEEKAALLAEVEAEGGKVGVVARRHRILNSLLYNWRSVWRAAVAARAPTAMDFMALGVIGSAADERAGVPASVRLRQPQSSGMADRVGGIEIALPNGAEIRVDAFVSEPALSRVFRALKGAL